MLTCPPDQKLERVMGIEPTYAAWEARLNPARSISYLQNFVIPVPMGSSGYERSAKLFAQPTNVRFAPKADIPTRLKPFQPEMPSRARHREARPVSAGAAQHTIDALRGRFVSDVAFRFRPDIFDRLFQIALDPDRLMRFIRRGIRALDPSGEFNRTDVVQTLLARAADLDHHTAVVTSRPPNPVV